MEQEPVVLGPIFSPCLLFVEKNLVKNKLNESSEKNQKQREIVQQDEIIRVYTLSKVKDV